MEVAVSRWKQNQLLWFQLRKRVVAMAAAELIKGSSGGTLCQSYLQCYCGVAALATPLWSLSFWLEGRRCSLAVATGGTRWPAVGGSCRLAPVRHRPRPGGADARAHGAASRERAAATHRGGGGPPRGSAAELCLAATSDQPGPMADLGESGF